MPSLSCTRCHSLSHASCLEAIQYLARFSYFSLVSLVWMNSICSGQINCRNSMVLETWESDVAFDSRECIFDINIRFLSSHISTFLMFCSTWSLVLLIKQTLRHATHVPSRKHYWHLFHHLYELWPHRLAPLSASVSTARLFFLVRPCIRCVVEGDPQKRLAYQPHFCDQCGFTTKIWGNQNSTTTCLKCEAGKGNWSKLPVRSLENFLLYIDAIKNTQTAMHFEKAYAWKAPFR